MNPNPEIGSIQFESEENIYRFEETLRQGLHAVERSLENENNGIDFVNVPNENIKLILEELINRAEQTQLKTESPPYEFVFRGRNPAEIIVTAYILTIVKQSIISIPENTDIRVKNILSRKTAGEEPRKIETADNAKDIADYIDNLTTEIEDLWPSLDMNLSNVETTI